MADNYLEKRYDEVFGKGAGSKVILRKANPSLDALMLKNRSYRGYDKSYIVAMRQLETIVGVNPKLASSRNKQMLRFKLVTKDTGADLIQGHYRLGGSLPELHLPFEGTEPEAFIIVCTTVPENASVDIDLGISCQSMLLKAVEIGLNGIIIRSFDREALREAFKLPLDPICLIAIGKGAENIVTTPVSAEEDIDYYRRDGVHYVPKIKAEDLVIR